jgi:hypothetical protein
MMIIAFIFANRKGSGKARELLSSLGGGDLQVGRME